MFSLSDDEVANLLSEESISEKAPWVTNDLREVEKFFKLVIAELKGKTGVHSLVEWTNYGSGYASFLDVWLYKESPDFAARHKYPERESYTGLVVVLSRLSPYFVFMEGEKSWSARGASSYLPNLDAIDDFQTQSVAELAGLVQPILESHEMIRLSHSMLDVPLDPKFDVHTVLTNRPFTLFDALFHWED